MGIGIKAVGLLAAAFTINDAINHFSGLSPSVLFGPGYEDFQTLDRDGNGRLTNDDISDARDMLNCLDKIVAKNPFMAETYAASRARLREALKSVD